MNKKLKPRYFVRLCTDAGWQEPVSFDRDWKLKQYQDPDIRITLIDDAAVQLNVPMNQVRAWHVDVQMVERD
jgi:hypothetical protein